VAQKNSGGGILDNLRLICESIVTGACASVAD